MNIAFIPARGGSKSIPLKNIKELNGRPLIYWTAKAANDAECIDKVVIATDSAEIKNTAESFNFSKLEVYERDPENARDDSSTESVMVEYISKSNLAAEDYFFLIQATSPMLKSEHIGGMFKSFLESGADSMFTGVLEKQFHWRKIEKSDMQEAEEKSRNFNEGKGQYSLIKPVNYDYRNRPRRQEFEGLIAENGACYINSVGNVLRDNCRLSGRIQYYELPAYTAHELDEEQDWIIVSALMRHFSQGT